MSARDYELEEFKREAARFLTTLTYAEKAVVIALHGDLGAGKTTFTQALAQALGVTESVVSPTFVIQKNYPLEGQVFSSLVHIDAYRLENTQQLQVLGWEELVSDPSNLIVVEWPENVAALFDENAQHVYLTYIDDDTRSISYNEHDKEN